MQHILTTHLYVRVIKIKDKNKKIFVKIGTRKVLLADREQRVNMLHQDILL